MRSVLVAAGSWATRVAAVVVLATSGLFLPAAPAFAHGQLALSKPLAGTVVNDPMQRLELYFTEQPPPNAHFAVTGPSGRIDNGWGPGQSVRLDKPVQEYFLVDGKWEPRVYNTGFSAMITVAHWPAKGPYVVDYLSVASDGEAVRGSLKFTYNGATSKAPAGWTPPTNGPAQSLLDQVNRAHAAHTGPGAPGARSAAAAPTAGTTWTAEPDDTSTASGRDSGSAVAWLIPVALIAITAVVIIHAARRPASAEPIRRRGSATSASGRSRRRDRGGMPAKKQRPARR